MVQIQRVILERDIRFCITKPGFQFATNINAPLRRIDLDADFKEGRINVIFLYLTRLFRQASLSDFCADGLTIDSRNWCEASTVSGVTFRRNATKLSAICSR
ncbi:hypothetical protein SGGMMB4_05804 (plasmid) [Sodalis glossinidius str. 'morsitans']|uniref:Uncharacterized protein n=1 Tax=Sodalis glossinidius (strain morsitans) TaxID=343509 RepID=A0A193QPG5_SODGM|nr:hypothetical protein SGGMMB4_05804 [Sodalis glossinidius str. 'morsitans']